MLSTHTQNTTPAAYLPRAGVASYWGWGSGGACFCTAPLLSCRFLLSCCKHTAPQPRPARGSLLTSVPLPRMCSWDSQSLFYVSPFFFEVGFKKLPGPLLKMQVPIQRIWAEARGASFLTSPHRTVTLPGRDYVLSSKISCHLGWKLGLNNLCSPSLICPQELGTAESPCLQ